MNNCYNSVFFDYTLTIQNRLYHVSNQHFARGVIAFWALSLNSAAAPAPTLSLTLAASNYNGYNISCFGMKDGSIDLAVSGGTAPYHYEWSNGATTEDVSQLAAGYYRVTVTDANSETAVAEITMEQPLAMKMDVDVYEYPNGYNVSCFDCYNGNASVLMLGGAAPFTVSWSDGPTGAERYNLGPKDYKITATDANGCGSTSATIYLRGPDRSDWSMGGNANSVPGPQYMGTSDAKDAVFKTNGQERWRLKANGDITLWGADTTMGPLYRDRDGTLRAGPDVPPLTEGLCYVFGAPAMPPYWRTVGNNFSQLCEDQPAPKLGTTSATDISIITHGVERMRVNAAGKVGIGTLPPETGNYNLFVENGISTRDVLVKTGAWPDFVFKPNYALMPLSELRAFLGAQHHLPGLPSEAQVAQQGGVELGDMQVRLTKVVEEQALYILQLEERQSQLEARLKALENARH
jgi:hypothetical protein